MRTCLLIIYIILFSSCSAVRWAPKEYKKVKAFQLETNAVWDKLVTKMDSNYGEPEKVFGLDTTYIFKDNTQYFYPMFDNMKTLDSLAISLILERKKRTKDFNKIIEHTGLDEYATNVRYGTDFETIFRCLEKVDNALINYLEKKSWVPSWLTSSLKTKENVFKNLVDIEKGKK